MFFVIPIITSKTFVMLSKKLSIMDYIHMFTKLTDPLKKNQGWGAGAGRSRSFLAARSRSRLRKKPGAGAGAAQRKNQEPEPEPPKLGGSGSGSLWLIIKQILKIILIFFIYNHVTSFKFLH